MTSTVHVGKGPPAADSNTRDSGEQLLRRFYASLRVLKLYPVGNARSVRSLDELHRAAAAIHQSEGELEIRVAGEFLFVNSTRLRLGMDNFASFSHVINTLHRCRIGGIRVLPGAEGRDWQIFVAALLTAIKQEDGQAAFDNVCKTLELGNVNGITIEESSEGDPDTTDTEVRKTVAKNTYQRSLNVTKELVGSVRMGRAANLRKVRRAVQNIVDQVLHNETSIVGLTTLRDHDDYTFIHSVNVCIFSLSIGKRLGLTKNQLYELGMAALLHDIGKSRVPLEVLNKKGSLTDDEWAIMKAHPWLGVLIMFNLTGIGVIPYRAMLVAHEHHMKIDLSGYPRVRRPRSLSLLSKLVAVADIYDAATSKRVYQATPNPPDKIIQEMIEQGDRVGVDGVFVKALVNVLGVYPVGTCVILDTYEVAIVHASNPNQTAMSRPIVRVFINESGERMDPAPLVDLTEHSESGAYRRSIIKVVDPKRYCVTPSDFFV